ncbi:MAG TPA: MdtA/MuxA family multidrug efflux RND transporter periplasmic adaptor subunit [Candidatus Angelobacter sp.]|jgi:multidrug efflux system membrane fusion protein|nr:MdtA/MuxA family multidrug efflux RND transporter periplasmic adaptor subunit [Candidatus Angelobacter sp.]
MFKFASWITWLGRIGFALYIATFLIGCGNSASKTAQASSGRGGRGQQGQAVPVAVAKAERRDLPIVLTGLGSIEAFNTVTIKSRIDGQLVQVAFREGQQVKKGDLLAVIDPRPYEVQLSQAQANLFKDQAALKDANVNLERFQTLFKEGVISKQQLDTQGSQAGQFEGAVRADQAQIENVKLNLFYTRITAPVNGRVGLRLVDIGNIVHAADPNGLLVLTQLQPISAVFTLPEDNLPTVARYMKRGTLQVEAYSRDDQTKLASGKLMTIDNQIDPATGTGKLKAVFENQDNALWPNQFVNMHLLLEVRKNNTVVPAAAIQRGPQGTYVFTVKPDGAVEMRPVSVSLTVGNYAAVDQGLQIGEQVVTDGQDKLQPGTHVEVRGGASPRQKVAQNSEAVKE